MVEQIQYHRQIRTIKHDSFDTVINYTNKELRERATRKARLVTLFKTAYEMGHIWVSVIEYDETLQEYLDRKEKYEKRKAELSAKTTPVQTPTVPASTPAKTKEKKAEVKEEPVDVDDIDLTEDI